MLGPMFHLPCLDPGCCCGPAAEPPRGQPTEVPGPAPAVEIDAETQKVLDEINSLNAYQRPKLPLKLEDRYAHTSDDVTPHGEVKPDKKHFLLQMEYTGPGRAIPEPEDVKTVKIGFLGPIYPTVSVATGGKSHEETLGKRMLQGCPTGDRGSQRPRRLPETQDPLRTGRQERQRPVGLLGRGDHQPVLRRQCLGHSRQHRRRQHAHRHPRRPEDRNPDDEQRRHRPHVHRNEHSLGHALHRRRPPAILPAGRLPVPQARSAAAWGSSAPAIATAASGSARSATAAGGSKGPSRPRWPTGWATKISRCN